MAVSFVKVRVRGLPARLSYCIPCVGGGVAGPGLEILPPPSPSVTATPGPGPLGRRAHLGPVPKSTVLGVWGEGWGQYKLITQKSTVIEYVLLFNLFHLTLIP